MLLFYRSQSDNARVLSTNNSNLTHLHVKASLSLLGAVLGPFLAGARVRVIRFAPWLLGRAPSLLGLGPPFLRVVLGLRPPSGYSNAKIMRESGSHVKRGHVRFW